MDAKSFILGAVVGAAAGAAGMYYVVKPKIEQKFFSNLDNLVEKGIESYKQGLDKAADGIISSKDAVNLVKAVQNKLDEGEVSESEVPTESFSSLDEGEDEEEADDDEPTDYAAVYDQYHKPNPTTLFKYTDDIPDEVVENQLDLEAELVVQRNMEKIDEFERELAERESPVEDEDDEARSRRRHIERERSKNAFEIDRDEFFDSNREYDKEAILYYKKDRVLCFENEEVIIDREELFGPDYMKIIELFNNTRVTSKDGFTLYLRNEFLKTDYEVIVYAGSYQHFVEGPALD